jgi:hypothetical protein
MSENIDAGTGVYITQIPTLSEDANIQEALRLYHYGSLTPPANVSLLESNSVAGHINALKTRVVAIEGQGVGSKYQSSMPTSAPDGFIWVDSSTSFGSINGTVSAYQNDAPTTGLIDGLIWVDKNSSPLKMYVYDAATSAFKEIGA